MAAGRSSFTKRQKEHARLQKRQDKAEKKKLRAENKVEGGPESDFATNDDFQITGDDSDYETPSGHAKDRAQ